MRVLNQTTTPPRLISEVAEKWIGYRTQSFRQYYHCCAYEELLAMEPQGKDFHHPFQPYDIQNELMSAIYDCITEGQVGIFESPTGRSNLIRRVWGSSIHWCILIGTVGQVTFDWIFLRYLSQRGACSYFLYLNLNLNLEMETWSTLGMSPLLNAFWASVSWSEKAHIRPGQIAEPHLRLFDVASRLSREGTRAR